MISARPPPPLSSSLDVVPKRFRSGSISSRLRSASELFDDGVIETRQQKGVLKDLIISGDEKLTEALSRYERGDKEPIKTLLREGVFDRKSSLDLLGDVGDLSFDFLSVSAQSAAFGNPFRSNIDVPFPMDDEEMSFEILLQESEVLTRSPTKQPLLSKKNSLSLPTTRYQLGNRSASLSSISSQHQPKSLGSLNEMVMHGFNSLGTSPPDLLEMHILDESGLGAWAHPNLRGSSHRRELDFDPDELDAEQVAISPKTRKSSLPTIPEPPLVSVSIPPAGSKVPLSKPRRNTPKSTGSASATSTPMAIPRPKTNSVGRQSSTGSTKRSAAVSSSAANNAHASSLVTEERVAIRRAQGVVMVGAYSPESRRQRVEKFVAKRDRRVWKKKVKYDVRKNFADSRLRVKGRFVKKEDEEMLRDLMTMV